MRIEKWKKRRLTLTDLVRGAMIIDTEGCITIARRKVSDKYITHTLIVTVSMAEKVIIDWLAQTFGGSVCRYEPRVSQLGEQTIHGYKTQWRWGIVSNFAAEFLCATLPYFMAKTAQAKLGLRFRQLTAVGSGKRISPEVWEMREQMYQEMRALKRISS